jgi:hypothetical protein
MVSFSLNNKTVYKTGDYMYIIFMLLFFICDLMSTAESSTITSIPTVSQPKWYRSSDKSAFNFAAYDVGAKILDSSPEAKKTSRILNEDKDNYMLIPRTVKKKWITIELSEEILMHSFALANFEYYSCSPRLFQVLGSREYPCRAPKCYWEVLGTFEAYNTRTVQTFMLQKPSITRYLKFLFLTHYGESEYFCTLSLLRVHGSTLLEDLKAALDDLTENIPKAINDHSSRNADNSNQLFQKINIDEDRYFNRNSILNSPDSKMPDENSQYCKVPFIFSLPITYLNSTFISLKDKVSNGTNLNGTVSSNNTLISFPKPTSPNQSIYQSINQSVCKSYMNFTNHFINRRFTNMTYIEWSEFKSYRKNITTKVGIHPKIDAIQPTHVEPDKRTKKSIDTKVADQSISMDTQPKIHHRPKIHEETSDNILKSLLIKIQKQEESYMILTHDIKSIHSNFKDSFRDIEIILNKTIYDHKLLASTVHSMKAQLMQEINQEIREQIKKEVSRILVQNVTESISSLRNEVMQSMYGHRKFMIICMCIPFIFMIFALLLCIPTERIVVTAPGRISNQKTINGFTYPADRRGRNGAFLDSDDESNIDEEDLVHSPSHQASKKFEKKLLVQAKLSTSENRTYLEKSSNKERNNRYSVSSLLSFLFGSYSTSTKIKYSSSQKGGNLSKQQTKLQSPLMRSTNLESNINNIDSSNNISQQKVASKKRTLRQGHLMRTLSMQEDYDINQLKHEPLYNNQTNNKRRSKRNKVKKTSS